MSSRLGRCQCDANCNIEDESHLHGMDVWQCGVGVACTAMPQRRRQESLYSTGMRY